MIGYGPRIIPRSISGTLRGVSPSMPGTSPRTARVSGPGFLIEATLLCPGLAYAENARHTRDLSQAGREWTAYFMRAMSGSPYRVGSSTTGNRPRILCQPYPQELYMPGTGPCTTRVRSGTFPGVNYSVAWAGLLRPP
jgi:hypothetical protein